MQTMSFSSNEAQCTEQTKCMMPGDSDSGLLACDGQLYGQEAVSVSDGNRIMSVKLGLPLACSQKRAQSGLHHPGIHPRDNIVFFLVFLINLHDYWVMGRKYLANALVISASTAVNIMLPPSLPDFPVEVDQRREGRRASLRPMLGRTCGYLSAPVRCIHSRSDGNPLVLRVTPASRQECEMHT